MTRWLWWFAMHFSGTLHWVLHQLAERARRAADQAEIGLLLVDAERKIRGKRS